MKVSFVSSQAINQAMRYQMLRMQADLVNAQQETVSGRVMDPGIALGARTGYSLSFSRESERLKGLIDSNQLATSRLGATQLGLKQMADTAQDLLESLVTATAGASNPNIVRQQAASALDMVTSILNANLNGEHLFAGINTDARPLFDFSDPASPNRVAFDQSFLTYFGFTRDDPASAGITVAQLDDFMATEIEPQFLGADWNTLWSTATDQQIISRITLTETAETSVSANIPAIRKLAMAAASVSYLLEAQLQNGVQSALVTRATELIGEAIVGLTNQQAYNGVTEQRLASASERLSMQVDLFTRTVSDMEGVDPYESATRVSGLLAQIEISYSLTARMQNLSLIRYLS